MFECLLEVILCILNVISIWFCFEYFVLTGQHTKNIQTDDRQFDNCSVFRQYSFIGAYCFLLPFIVKTAPSLTQDNRAYHSTTDKVRQVESKLRHHNAENERLWDEQWHCEQCTRGVPVRHIACNITGHLTQNEQSSPQPAAAAASARRAIII